MTDPKPVIIESPYAGKNPQHYRRNIQYLHAIIQDCLARGEIPYASHNFYPGALDDTVPAQREQGIKAGFATAEVFHRAGGYRIFAMDRGQSSGMQYGQRHCDTIGMLSIERKYGPEWSVENDPPHCEHIDGPGDYDICPHCGEEFEEVVLPKSAIAVAKAWITKKA